MTKALWLACSILLLLINSAKAENPNTVFIEELTWTELRDAIRSGKTTVILPVGGTEQNGPHIVIGKHNFIVKYTAEQIARQLNNALVAPVVAYVPEGDIDPPTGHMRFPGTITFPREHFIKLIEYAARSFKLHGFRDIVLIGDHGSYQKDLSAVAEALTREWSSSAVRVHFIAQYYSSNGFTTWLASRGATKAEMGPHASTVDTSEVLALNPDYVRMHKLQETGPDSGVQGDPRGASAELGRRGLQFKIDTAVSRIRQVVGTPAAK